MIQPLPVNSAFARFYSGAPPGAGVAFSLFERDVKGANLSFRLFSEALAAVSLEMANRLAASNALRAARSYEATVANDPSHRHEASRQSESAAKAVFDALRAPRADRDPISYHACCFICAVRRVGRLLEFLGSGASVFPPALAAVARLEWRKKKMFFDSYVDSRNAIEHIDGEVAARTVFRFFSLTEEHKFQVSGEDGAEVTEAALNNMISAFTAICEAIQTQYPNDFATSVGNGPPC